MPNRISRAELPIRNRHFAIRNGLRGRSPTPTELSERSEAKFFVGLRIPPQGGTAHSIRGRSSAWLERLPVTQEVASSSLVGPAEKAHPSLEGALFL